MKSTVSHRVEGVVEREQMGKKEQGLQEERKMWRAQWAQVVVAYQREPRRKERHTESAVGHRVVKVSERQPRKKKEEVVGGRRKERCGSNGEGAKEKEVTRSTAERKDMHRPQ